MNPIAFGIDISKWQGNFDMARAKSEGVKFVIIKGGGSDNGLYKDARFEENYEKAKRQSLQTGCYWFSRATSVDGAKEEAEFFYKHILKGKQFELPVYIDIEHKDTFAKGKRVTTDIIKTWCSYLWSLGYFAGVYSSTYWFADSMHDEELQNYAHWVAQWSENPTYKYPAVMGMWQFGGETNKRRPNKVAGVVCDQNYLYTDYYPVIKRMNLNGFGNLTPKTNTRTGTKSILTIAKEVISGLWDNGEARKKKLKEAGYDYAAVQKQVNELLKK